MQCMKNMAALFLMLLIIGVTYASASEGTFKNVDLDSFIVQEQKVGEKGKIIKMAEPLGFDAVMKRFPEERELSYIYKALELAGVDPLPEVNHRMFIESAEGRIIPVYIEKEAVKKVKKGLKVEQKAHWMGYHVYSYAKGPAILVVDYTFIK